MCLLHAVYTEQHFHFGCLLWMFFLIVDWLFGCFSKRASNGQLSIKVADWISPLNPLSPFPGEVLTHFSFIITCFKIPNTLSLCMYSGTAGWRTLQSQLLFIHVRVMYE